MDQEKTMKRETVTKEKVVAAIQEMSDEEFGKFIGGNGNNKFWEVISSHSKNSEDIIRL